MTFQPRDYQRACVDATRAAWLKHRSVLNVLATGLGKTEIACMLMGQAKRSLFLVHRDELVRQTVAKLYERHGTMPEIEKAELQHNPFSDADVVASVQSCQGARLARFQPQDFQTIIVDEAHHAVAPTYRKVLDYFPDASIVGFTATANRTDDKALELVFERMATPSGACFNFPIAKGTNEGWLVPLQCQEITVKGLDLSKIKVNSKTGEFNQRQLDRAMSEEGVLHGMAKPILDWANGKQGVIFCAGVEEAVKLSEVLNKITGNPNTAAAIHCDTKDYKMKKAVRRSFIRRYREGDIQFLLNFMILNEGFDAPGTMMIGNCSPTPSSLIVTQRLGRGTRPLVCQKALGSAQSAQDRRSLIRSSDKPSCLVLDFKGKTANAVKLASVEDALGGDYDDEIKERAKRLRVEGRGVTDNLELAAAEMELLAEMAADRTWFKPDVIYESKEVDLYGQGVKHEVAGVPEGVPCSDKQRRYLWVLHKKLGLPWDERKARSWTKGQAGAIISNLQSKSSSSTSSTKGFF